MSPVDWKRYPKNWPAVRDCIRARAAGRCECEGECGLHHGRRCVEVHGDPAAYAKGKVVLTVAHLDHNEQNCDHGNLKAMCPRCHLRYDQPHHQANARKTRAARRAQLALPIPEVAS